MADKPQKAGRRRSATGLVGLLFVGVLISLAVIVSEISVDDLLKGFGTSTTTPTKQATKQPRTPSCLGPGIHTITLSPRGPLMWSCKRKGYIIADAQWDTASSDATLWITHYDSSDTVLDRYPIRSDDVKHIDLYKDKKTYVHRISYSSYKASGSSIKVIFTVK